MPRRTYEKDAQHIDFAYDLDEIVKDKRPDLFSLSDQTELFQNF